jgi:hypothetical protein
MKKALVLIDYENLAGGARDLNLELTKDGYQHFVDYLNDSYAIDDGMLNVVCRFDDFPSGLQRYFESLSCETIDAIDLGKDVADGYVIIEAVTQLIANKDSIEEVVLVGGDNVYSGLVRTIVKTYRKSVKVISWEQCLADSLTTINENKVHIEYPEDIFKIATNEHFDNGWLRNGDCTELEVAVITFVENSKFKNNYEVHKLADRLVASTDERVAIFTDFHETKNWIFSQAGAEAIFHKDKQGKKWHVKLNRTNHKVQTVLNQLPTAISE